MDLIHSTFQASFNARIERLAEQEANELRTIFRYFDTDGDGAVSADQVLRIFGLLGLNINPAYVRDLEEVYLAEFLKIVDSNVPVVAMPSLNPGTTATPLVVPMLATTAQAEAAVSPDLPNADPEAQERANTELWETEWRAIDSYERGFVSRDELRLFLRSCFSPFSGGDLDRFLELYADPSMPEDSMTLTKAAFLKFRHDYTTRERLQTEHGDSSDDEDGEGDGDLSTVDRGMGMEESDNAHARDSEATTSRAKRPISAPPVPDGQEDADADVGGIVIDPTVVDDDFVDEDDATADDDPNVSGDLVGDDGTLYEEEDEGDDEDADGADE